MAFTGATLPNTSLSDAKPCLKRRYVAQLASDFAQIEMVWERMAQQGAALPFQRRNWLKQWYRAHENGSFAPLLITVMDSITKLPVMGLPLVMSRQGGMRIISFADSGLTDYNAPILGAGAPPDRAGALLAMQAICKILPPADVLQFDKMPEMIGAVPNPMALLPSARASVLTGNILHVPTDWDTWHWALPRTFRKELERSLRVFLKAKDAKFLRVTEPDEVARIYATLKCQQRERIAELGLPYILDEPCNELFYDQLLSNGIANGSAVLTALVAGGEVVAALLGICNDGHYAMVRLATAGAAWKNCSPGRLLIERTMRSLHAQGFHTFDFTIGDYPYKRRMGVTVIPLRDMTLARSWRGWPVVAGNYLRHRLRRSPRFAAILKRMLHRPVR